MDLRLKGKTAVVTGASRGLGRAIAGGLAAEGCRLVICARGADGLQEAADELRAGGAEVEARPLDVTEDGAVEELVATAEARFGVPEVVVGNVGGNRRGALTELEDEAWRQVFELNFQSQVRLARSAARRMLAHEIPGSIVFVASIFGREAGGAGLGIYNASKSALISMAKILSLELAPAGIRVNTVAPGSIRFPGGSWDRRCLEDPEGMERFIAANLPLGRFGRADEIADAVTFLASERASLVTGTCWNVDGGQSRSLI